MNETRVTVVGNLVNAVESLRLSDGRVRARFRVASTERRYDRSARTWGDGDSLYVDVTCWRELAENAQASLVKGDPVVVTGRLFTRQYEHEGQRRSALTLEAQSIGPDLSWCTAAVSRTRRRSAGEATGEGGAGAGAAEATDGTVVEVPRLVAVAPGGEG